MADIRKKMSSLFINGCDLSRELIDVIKKRDDLSSQGMSRWIGENYEIIVTNKVVQHVRIGEPLECEQCNREYHAAAKTRTCSVQCAGAIRILAHKESVANREREFGSPKFIGLCKQVRTDVNVTGWLYQPLSTTVPTP